MWQFALLSRTSALYMNVRFSKVDASCLEFRWEVMEARVYSRHREYLLWCLHSARYKTAMIMGQISKCQTSIDSNTDKYLEHTEFGASQQPNDMDGKKNCGPILNFFDLIIFFYCIYLCPACSLNKLKLELCGTINALGN